MEKRYASVDESKLSEVDRLGLAFCRLNTWGWDEIVGPKPEGFDQLPNISRDNDEVSKSEFISPKLNEILDKIGFQNANRCWWVFHLEETEEEWRKWWTLTHPE